MESPHSEYASTVCVYKRQDEQRKQKVTHSYAGAKPHLQSTTEQPLATLVFSDLGHRGLSRLTGAAAVPLQERG